MFGKQNTSPVDMLSVGDVTTDAFIRISHASIYRDDDNEELICLVNASKIPYESVTIVPAVGNSANAAVAAARLGLRSALAADVGDDTQGSENITTLKKNKVITDWVRTHKNKKSNYHYVLWYHADRTILIKHETYERTLPTIPEPRWVYLSSLGEDALDYQEDVIGYVLTHPNIKLAFQPGTFQIKSGYDAFKEVYLRAETFFCNVEEARIILKDDTSNAPTLARIMHEKGPRIAVITDGPKGAYMATDDGVWYMPIYPDPKPPFERTGAGDAFASTFTTFLALGKTPEEALVRAPINSMSVVQYVGAQEGLLPLSRIEQLLSEKPEGYEPKKLA
ncbi:MAG: carbohydrate kinase family protein [Candidatus Yonathbacteria bacterium]|nr:carbohydrate kinase family protein [Candidatus Yonathbacteria bacterium]